jgi:hypothetical protein
MSYGRESVPVRWNGSKTAVRRGAVPDVVYVLWLLLAAKLAEAAVAVRKRTATAKRR